jgi:allantoicase
MGDGWETKRRRGPGHDWIILSLGKAGKIEKVIVDTAHFKGNYPHQFSLDGVYTGKNDIPDSEVEWKELIGKEFLTADKEHVFTKINQHQKISHVRLNIFPDGGVSRLRVFGYIHE